MRILFVAPRIRGTHVPGRVLATFHEADVRLLRELGHDVDVLPWQGRPWLSLMRRALRADVIYVWTVGDHTVLAILLGRLLRKPVLVVLGGYEYANLPDLHYGNLSHARGQLLSGIVWKSHAFLLPVDETLVGEALNALGERRIQGRTRVLPTGYDSGFWAPDGKDRENLVLTVAHCPGLDTLRLKGIDRFIALATQFPHLVFALAGTMPASLSLPDLPDNVLVLGWVEPERLRRLMRRALVYAQLSRHEGLPNALCEAMLCGCVPVGTPVNGIPTAIGMAGILSWDSRLDALALDAALSLAARPGRVGENPRERILTHFPLERRREGLRRILAEVTA